MPVSPIDTTKYREATQDRQDDAITLLTSIRDAVELLQRQEIISGFEAHGTYTALNAQTTNKADTTTHITGAKAVTFDKAAGATVCGLQDTITSLDLSEYVGHAVLKVNVYLSTINDVDSIEIRLGTDSSNANIWQIAAADLEDGWNILAVEIGDVQTDLGNGWDDSAITYLAVAVNFSDSADTLTGIIVDSLSIQSTIRTKLASAAAERAAELVIEDCDNALDGEWSNSYDSGTLAVSRDNITGHAAVQWNKVGNLGANSGVQKLTMADPIDGSDYGPDDFIAVTFLMPSITNMNGASLEVGTDQNHYLRWQWHADQVPSDASVTLYAKLKDHVYTKGNGWELSDISFLRFYVKWVDTADAVSAICRLDRIAIISAEEMAAVRELEKRVGTVPAPQATGATMTDDTWIERFTIPADTVFARVMFDQKCHCMAGISGTDPAQDGVPYQPNILYDIPCGKNAAGVDYDTLFCKNETGSGAADVTPDCTFYRDRNYAPAAL